MKETIGCRGQQGSWFATVTTVAAVDEAAAKEYGIEPGTSLPCVHSRFWVMQNGKPEHHEPFLNPDHPYGSEKYIKYFDAIKKGLVILTNSKWSEDNDGHLHATRTGYVAIFKVANVRDDNGILEWDYVERIASCI